MKSGDFEERLKVETSIAKQIVIPKSKLKSVINFQ